MHSYRFVSFRTAFRTAFGAAFSAALLLCVTACRDAADDRARANGIVDDFGDTLALASPPQRIVSLNPATTELVFALGAGSRLVGRSRWDTYPDSARLVPDLGDGMRPNVEVVLASRADLVLLYASGENRSARDALRRSGVATLAQRFDRIAEFGPAVVQLGRVLGDTMRAHTVRDSVYASLERARVLVEGRPRPRVVWPLWLSPLLAAGRGSFLTDLLVIAGAENIFADIDAPSPQVTFEEIVRRDPDIVLAGPVQAAELRAEPRWRALRAVREGRIAIYDTTLVGRPGVRLGEAALHLASVLHPSAGTGK